MRIYKDKVCCLSDIHIGLHQAQSTWHNITLEFALWLREQLIARNIKDIIIPGDVLDDRNEVSVLTIHYLRQFFQIFDDFNIIISVGNHDCYYNKRSDVHSLATLDEWNNITIIDELTTITSHDKIITFCPWNTALSDIPKSDIIFGHWDIKSFRMAGKKVCEHGVPSKDLLNLSETIITGHYHLTQHRTYTNGSILYLGSPYEQNWGESMSPKGVYILDLEDGSHEFVENTISPKHRKIRLSELIDLGSVTEEIKEEFDGNIIKFIIDVEANQAVIDNLVKKFSLFKPLDLTVEYEYVQHFNMSDEEFDFSGVDVRTDIIEFVNSLDNIEDAEEVNKYLADIYKRAEVLVK